MNSYIPAKAPQLIECHLHARQLRGKYDIYSISSTVREEGENLQQPRSLESRRCFRDEPGSGESFIASHLKLRSLTSFDRKRSHLRDFMQ